MAPADDGEKAMNRLRVLVAGAGRAGMVHARNFAAGIPGARLELLADPSEEARELATTELDCATVDDPLAAATDNGIDAVVIAGPTFTHAEIALAALRAGKAVLCEKPLASSLGEAREIVSMAKSSPGPFLMGFMRRFDAGFARVAARISAGDIGKPVLVRSTTRGPGLPPHWSRDTARSGGLIAEVNSHDLDTARHFTGEEFTAVYAAGRAAKRPDLKAEHPDFVDVAVATFDLTGDVLAQIDGACPAGYGYDARAEVYGTEGTILVGGPAADTAVVVRDGTVTTDSVRGWRDLFDSAYRTEDTHLVAVARGEAKPSTSAEDGLRALEAAVAVNRSIAEGRKVTIDEVAGG